MKRIQRKNFFDYSWKADNGVYVGRPTRWGNPFKISEYVLDECLRLYRKWLHEQLAKNPAFLEPLKGKNLVCFCATDKPCHADVIMEFLGEGGPKQKGGE